MYEFVECYKANVKLKSQYKKSNLKVKVKLPAVCQV